MQTYFNQDGGCQSKTSLYLLTCPAWVTIPGASPLDGIDLLVNATTSWQGMDHVVEGASPMPDLYSGSYNNQTECAAFVPHMQMVGHSNLP